MTSITLTDEQLDRLADALADRLAERLAVAASRRSPLVSAGALAEILGVTRDYVYRHAEDLGAVRLGDGPRSEHGGSRLRFDVDQPLAAQSARQSSESSQPSDPAPAGRSPRRRQSAPGSGVELPPVGGRKVAGRSR